MQLQSHVSTSLLAAAGEEPLCSVSCPYQVVGVRSRFGLASSSGHIAATDTVNRERGGRGGRALNCCGCSYLHPRQMCLPQRIHMYCTYMNACFWVFLGMNACINTNILLNTCWSAMFRVWKGVHRYVDVRECPKQALYLSAEQNILLLRTLQGLPQDVALLLKGRPPLLTLLTPALPV